MTAKKPDNAQTLLEGLIDQIGRRELVLKEVELKGAFKGYTLREMTGELRDEYQQVLFTEHYEPAKEKNEKGERELKTIKYKDMQAILVCRSLWKDDKLVPIETVRCWPWEEINRLYEAARLISGLDKDGAKTAVKNSEEAKR